MKRKAQSKSIVTAIQKILKEHKATNIVVIDLKKKTIFTDYFIIATANSNTHLKALCNEVESALKQKGILCKGISGIPESGWMVMDYINVVVHIFREETRRYYDLESLWGSVEAKIRSVRKDQFHQDQ